MCVLAIKGVSRLRGLKAKAGFITNKLIFHFIQCHDEWQAPCQSLRTAMSQAGLLPSRSTPWCRGKAYPILWDSGRRELFLLSLLRQPWSLAERLRVFILL